MSRLYPGFLTVLLLGCMQPSGAVSSYDQGFSSYKAGDYKQAARFFGQAVQESPGKQLYHYFLANSLVHLREHARASQEYKLAYLLDPATNTGEFARQALLAYNKKNAAAVDDDQTTVSSGSALEKAKSSIEKQANFEKDKFFSAAAQSQRTIRMQLETELRRIDERAQYEIQKLREPLVYTPEPRANRLLAMPEVLKEREDQIRLAALKDKERATKEAEERLRPFDQLSKGREQLLDETALNLKMQLEQPAGPSGVKLQTHGTGLYVRYYGKSAPSRYPDARPATAIIKTAGSEHDPPLDTEPEKTVYEVDGKLIKDYSASIGTGSGI